MTDNNDARVRILSKDVKYHGWASMTVYTVELAGKNGSKQVVREIEHHGNSVAILPYDPDRQTVLLTRQFRLAAHLNGHSGWLTEVCAGMIDGGETAEQAVVREAREELGVQLKEVRRVADTFVSPGASMEKAALFSARYGPADRVGGGGGVDHGEDIEVLEMPLSDAARMIRDGTIVDAKTIILIQAALLVEEKLRR
jgi:nudix-type nucleoside diphosphatase (YffH/AdpP family)